MDTPQLNVVRYYEYLNTTYDDLGKRITRLSNDRNKFREYLVTTANNPGEPVSIQKQTDAEVRDDIILTEVTLRTVAGEYVRIGKLLLEHSIREQVIANIHAAQRTENIYQALVSEEAYYRELGLGGTPIHDDVLNELSTLAPQRSALVASGTEAIEQYYKEFLADHLDRPESIGDIVLRAVRSGRAKDIKLAKEWMDAQAK